MLKTQLPLSYCTNVHPAKTLEDVKQSIIAYTLPIRSRYGAPLAAGLWLARSVTEDILQSHTALSEFAAFLRRHNLPVYTLNAFPFGDFHQERVKEQVYLPDWTDPQRLAYTQDCATILAGLLDDNIEGSISTLPLGFKPMTRVTTAFYDDCITQLLKLARFLHDLARRTGKLIRIAVEPEPLCLLETTPEAIAFFKLLFALAARKNMEDQARNHLGLCFDVCHQAVEFEDLPGAIAAIDAAGIRINKVHLSAALRLGDPGGNSDGRRALTGYIEPRYQHQVAMKQADGKIEVLPDLDPLLLNSDSARAASLAAATEVRLHFHVPINLSKLGPLLTTADQLPLALRAIAKLPYAPHLEVETYTWPVLATADPAANATTIVDGLAKELLYANNLMRES